MIAVKELVFYHVPQPTIVVLFDNERYQMVQHSKPVASASDIADMLVELAENIRNDENLI